MTGHETSGSETPADRAVSILRGLDAVRPDAPTPASGRDRVAARLADTGLAIVLAVTLIVCASVATAFIYGNREIDAHRVNPEPGEVIIGLGVIVVWGLALV